MPRAGIIFDLAALADTDAAWAATNRVPTDPHDNCAICTVNPSARNRIDHIRDSVLNEFTRQLEAGAAPLHPHVADFLADLRQREIPTAVVSSLGQYDVDVCLEATGLRDLVDAAHAAQWRVDATPTPELHLAAIRSLGIDPAYSLSIEHDADGVAAARDAGLLTLSNPTLAHSIRADRHLGRYAPVDVPALIELAAAPRPVHIPEVLLRAWSQLA